MPSHWQAFLQFPPGQQPPLAETAENRQPRWNTVYILLNPPVPNAPRRTSHNNVKKCHQNDRSRIASASGGRDPLADTIRTRQFSGTPPTLSRDRPERKLPRWHFASLGTNGSIMWKSANKLTGFSLISARETAAAGGNGRKIVS